MADRYQYEDRSRRERYQRGSNQAEQFQSDYGYDDDRSSGQMGESWRSQDGQHDNDWQTGQNRHDRDRGQQGGYGSGYGADYNRGGGSRYGGSSYGGDRYDQGRGGGFGSDYQSRNYQGGGQRSRSYGSAGGAGGPSWDTAGGAGSQLARSHGEWHESDYGRSRSYDRDAGRSYGYERDQDDDRGFLEKAGDKIASWLGDDDDYRRDRAMGDRGGYRGYQGQSYRGHGPSGYTRSDDRVLEDANERLTHDHRVDARNIQVSVKDGEVTLNGTVTSRDQKRRAEDCVEDLSGVKHVQNNLRVQDNTSWDRTNSGDRARSATAGATGTSGETVPGGTSPAASARTT